MVELAELFKLWLAPEVTSLVVTRNPNGTINVSPTDWVHKVAYKPPMVVVCKKHSTDTCSNLSTAGKKFTICVPGHDRAQEVLLCSKPLPPTESELQIEGVEFEVVDTDGVFSLAGMVWVAECEVQNWVNLDSHRVFFCEVLRLDGDPARVNRDELMHLKFKTFCQPGGNYFDKPGF